MEISTGMVAHYLIHVTGYISELDGCEPEDISEYYDSIMDMKIGADRHNDLEPLQLAIEYLLTHPEIDSTKFLSGIHYNYTQEQSIELLSYIRKILWPDLPAPKTEKVLDVNLVPMPTFDWWKMRTDQGLHPDFSKEVSISA
jgi:hypothetical protein